MLGQSIRQRPQLTPAAIANGTAYHVDMNRIRPQCLDAYCSDRSAREAMSFFGKNQTRKRTIRKMEETSRTVRVRTMKRMTEATRCGCAVCVSGEG